MMKFGVRFSGGLILIFQAFFLQFLWTPNHAVIDETPMFIAFTISVFLALLAAIGFLLLRSIGWLVAMLVQGTCLLTALLIRFYLPTLSTTAHLTMLYSIGMVLYLNSFPVRTAFGSHLNFQERSES